MQKIIYWIATGLLSLLMLASAGMYIFNHAEVAKIFQSLGYPAYIIYPLAIAKILGITAILTKYSRTLKDFAYAGFLFNFLLALSAHLNAGDGGFGPAAGALILWTVSFVLDRKLYQ